MACEHREEEAVTHRQSHAKLIIILFVNCTPGWVEQEKLGETFRKACLGFKRAFVKDSYDSSVNTILNC